MRIALVTTEFVTEELFDGGLANYINRVAISLKFLGHKPIILVASDRTEIIKHKGIDIHRIKVDFLDESSFTQSKFINKFYRTFRYINNSRIINNYLKSVHKAKTIDIIQYTHLCGLGLSRITYIPSVIRLSAYTREWMKAYEINGFVQQFFWEKIALFRSDAIFGPSNLVNNLVKKEIHKNICLIESPFINDIENENFEIYQQNLANKKYLLFFGSVGLLKGIDTISKILLPIFNKYTDLYFVIAGKDLGYPDGRPIIPQLYNRINGFEERLIYLGRLRHEELYPIIKNSFGVILPSRIDNFPNTCIEAMAHSKIVIGTLGTSFEQLISDGINGFLCKVDDDNDLLRAIEKLMALSFSEKSKMEDLAFQRTQKLRPEIVVNQLVDFYKEVINKKKEKKGK